MDDDELIPAEPLAQKYAEQLGQDLAKSSMRFDIGPGPNDGTADIDIDSGCVRALINVRSDGYFTFVTSNREDENWRIKGKAPVKCGAAWLVAWANTQSTEAVMVTAPAGRAGAQGEG